MIQELRRTARGESFYEQPMPEFDSEAVDFRAASESFAPLRTLKTRDLERWSATPDRGGFINWLRVYIMLLVCYFHGYGSSPESGKVEALRKGLGSHAEVYSFAIDIDPDIARPYLEDKILMTLLDEPHREDQVLFVGTSLGGWWAGTLAKVYGFPSVLINPSFEPALTLSKRPEVPSYVLDKYTSLGVPVNATFFFALNDTVIDNAARIRALQELGVNEVYIDPDADHRFNGEPFNRVINFIRDRYIPLNE